MASLKQLDRALQTANTWLNELTRGLDVDRSTAWHTLGAVLHTLRDRLSTDEARHFGAQLPLMIRGLFFEQWGPHHRLPRMRTKAQFVERVRSRMKSEAVEPQDAIAVVFSVLVRHPTGEIQKLLKILPASLRQLIPASTSEAGESPFAWE